MTTILNYGWCILLVLAGLGMTYLNLQRDVGVSHWLVVGLMFAGAYYQYQKAGQVAE
jgi:hypothetical protein